LETGSRTFQHHAYPHKSGMMLCDVFVMQEEQHGRAQQRFMARFSEDGDRVR
jgi:hypothetical protein